MPAYPQIQADFVHQLTGRKGYPLWSQLNTKGKVVADQAAAAYAGRAAHFNGDGDFELGARQAQMPLFLTASTQSFDVATTAHNSYGGAIIPEGTRGALVATGAYELETTEFDTTKTWNANDPIYSPTAGQITGDDKSKAGLLFKSKNWPGGSDAAYVPGTDKVIGIASWGRRSTIGPAVTGPASTHPNLVPVLAFWPVFQIGSN